MKQYACIISTNEKAILLSVAQQFSYSIELLDDGILFDVSGLENLIGDGNKISQKILDEMTKRSVAGNVAVAETIDTATILARDNRSAEHIVSPDNFAQLPLHNLLIEDDTRRVFHDLGIRTIGDLQQVPSDELINRYGQQFKTTIDIIEQKGQRLLTPNIKENEVSWTHQLDFPVDDFEQLVFILNHGLDILLNETSRYGFSTEHLDIFFRLQKGTERVYDIKTSFPTLDKTFWLKLINLRISLDPPESEIVAIRVTSHFTPPRPAQRGLYAVSRPDPERLLLTVNKLKKLVGEQNVGVPVLLDERVEKAFALDAEAMPSGKEHLPDASTGGEALSIPDLKSEIRNPVIAFSYFNPPVQAEVLVRDKKLVFIRTQFFSGHVTRYSGVWKANSKWWDRSWKAQEWDIEIEDHGVYRLCKVDKEWFLAGEYD